MAVNFTSSTLRFTLLMFLSCLTTMSESKTIMCKNCNIGNVLENVGNNTEVVLSPGRYVLDRNISRSFLSNISVSGASGKIHDVHIRCVEHVGFSFARSVALTFKGFSVLNCGSKHLGTSLYNVTFLAVFHFVYCHDLTFNKVSVSNNSAIGVNLHDVGGNIKFIDSIFANNTDPDKEYSLRWGRDTVPGGGGGVYVQFTYCGAYYGDTCDPDDNIEHQNYIHGNKYTFENCVFSNNYAPGPPKLPGRKNTDFLPPQGKAHMSLGRGAGLSIYIRGNASYNDFKVIGSNFTDNFAQWGGGFFAELVDSCNHNNVLISKSKFMNNRAKWAGGGIRYGLIQVFDGGRPYNNATFEDCIFTNNSAIWGGGSSVYSTEETATADGKASSEINFIGVTWIKNQASNGAAVGCASWKILAAGGIVKPKFLNCVFHENKMIDYRLSENITGKFSYSVVEGQGAICTNAMPMHFIGKSKFEGNVGTAILLTDAVLSVDSVMEFIRNTGHDGGGISIQGQSWIVIHPHSSFLFLKNIAVRGAGIFARYPGTPNRVASKNCFITYSGRTTAETLISPDKWKTHFNFSFNNASVAGHSIHASTLKYCEWYMEVYGFKSRQIFNWTNFVYENSSPMTGYEITTDPVDVQYQSHDWTDLSPSDVFNPTVELMDERRQLLPGIVFVKVMNNNVSNTAVDVSSGPYFPADKKIYSFRLKGKYNTNFSLVMQTVTGRVIKGIIPQVSLQYCRPGYYMSSSFTCLCLKSPYSPYSSYETRGITRCQGDRKVYIRKGLWAGTISLGPTHPPQFITYPCPNGYCDFNCKPKDTCAPHEYLFFKDPSRQCQGHRTGILCGRCEDGYSVVLGSDNCKKCPNDNTWVGYFVLFIVIGTILVFGVLILNVDISSGHYTGCMFFYQVVSLMVRDGFETDPVMNFLMGLANAQVGVGACMWYGMTDLEKLAFTYVLPTYILFLCGVVIYLSRYPGCVFSRRSALRAFSTLFLISYTTFTSVSLELLNFASLDEKLVLYKSGEVPYFKGSHLGFAILAILVGIVIVIPFPFFLILKQPISYIKPGFGSGKLKAFVDIFQGGYKTEYRWFSGVYYLARIALLLINTLESETTLRHSLLAGTCLGLLTLLSNIRPYGTRSTPDKDYARTWINTLDSLILTDLTTIAVLGSFSASSDSSLTSLVSSNYTVSDCICLFLIWIPMVYFICILVYNINRAWKKRQERIRRMLDAPPETTMFTSKTSSLGFDSD